MQLQIFGVLQLPGTGQGKSVNCIINIYGEGASGKIANNLNYS